MFPLAFLFGGVLVYDFFFRDIVEAIKGHPFITAFIVGVIIFLLIACKTPISDNDLREYVDKHGIKEDKEIIEEYIRKKTEKQ